MPPCLPLIGVRNAVGPIKTIAAARMDLHGDGQHHVSLDKAIATMLATGADMSAQAEAGSADELMRARIGLLRGQMAFASSHGADTSRLLLHTARQLEPLDIRLARETYLDALAAAIYVGRLPGGAGLPEVARAALGAPPAPQPSRAPDLLLDGLAVLITNGSTRGPKAAWSGLAARESGRLRLRLAE